MIPPGSTIGILGGGQLGRMLVLAGRALGYRFHVFEPHGPCAAGRVADREVNASYDDEAALLDFAKNVDLVTLEFENIPASALEKLAAFRPVHPRPAVLHVCQHRQREKDFLRAAGFPCVPFAYAASADDLAAAVRATGFPCVVKTAAFGYDGKGQVKLDRSEDAADEGALWNRLGQPSRVVVEKWIQHRGEFSVICARRSAGECVTFPMAENIHRRHILHQSVVPARVPDSVRHEGDRLARALAEALDVVGLLAVELFLDADGRLLVNELAPRPHNSGHYTIDACRTSQFEQHLRAVADLPFGSTDLLRPAVMVNLLGDLWTARTPDWSMLLKDPRVSLHLYDKGEPRPDRKMGHFCLLDPDPASAIAAADALFKQLDSEN